MSTPAAAVFGCEGPSLDAWERAFFRETEPYGFIVFARNVADPEQLRRLTGELRESVGREAPVLVDQEGGRVQRLRPPHWSELPSAARLATLGDEAACLAAIRATAALTAAELLDCGIDVNCAPCLDLLFSGAHHVIGDRSFGADPDQVAAFGRAYWEALLAAGVMPIMKHLPGHGRAQVDSHEALPRVETDLETLAGSDFRPFRDNRDCPWAMTAHVVFADCDPDRPATLSPTAVTEIVRGRIGFDGVLISDDLSMGALGGSMVERTAAALAAGCDLVLHCNGKRDEMTAVADALRPLDQLALVRLEAARARLGAPRTRDIAQLRADLAALLEGPGPRMAAGASH